MKDLTLWLFFAFSVFQVQAYTVTSDSSVVIEDLEAKKVHSQQAVVIAQVLMKHHFAKTPVDDSLSTFVFDTFINLYDFNKTFFTKADIEEFEPYRYKLDDHIISGDLSFPFEFFNKFKKTFYKRYDLIDSILNQGFDFTKDEYLEISRKDADWAVDKEELDDAWRLLLKNQMLTLSLAGKSDSAAYATVRKRYQRLEKYVRQTNNEDVFEIFMNSFTAGFDPHTNYFSPISSDKFKTNMSLSFEGIGARLTIEDDVVKITEIIPGGPAFRSKKLVAGDKIVGVGQENDTTYVDVIGWRLDEVVQLIKGPKDTKVQLFIRKVDALATAPPVKIVLVRDKIKLEEQSASKEIIPMSVGGKEVHLGVITVPSFYLDFAALRKGDRDYKSTTTDVRKLLEEFKAEGNIDGVVLDLRNNGGGSLLEAINLSGLFINQGPMVQVKQLDGAIDVKVDKDPAVVYDGPLTVLINRYSASASEIFAGAMQDYQRGVIIGETSFGKGTVQQLVGLESFIRNVSPDDKLGQLKLTTAKFYRVSGSSTQHKGVVPDVLFPSVFESGESGESAQVRALPWDEISHAHYTKTKIISSKIIKKLSKKHEKRMESEDYLLKFSEDITSVKERLKLKEVSLNKQKRFEELEENKGKEDEDDLEESLSGEGDLNNDAGLPKSVLNDPVLRETLNVLNDLISEV